MHTGETNMLQSIREKTSGWVASIILGLIILTMAFFGIESYLTPKIDTYAARVEGPAKFLGFGKQVRDITVEEFRKRFEQTRQQQREAQAKDFDAAAFEKIENKRLVLDQLIDEALLSLVSEREGLVLTKSAVQKEIMSVDAFKVAGRFDPNQYKLVLQSQNMTPKQFEDLVSGDLIRQLIPSQLADSQFAGDSELDAFLRISRQTRDIRFLEIPPSPLPVTAPTDAELKAWYDAHASQYRSPEKVAIEYVELNAATMPVNVVADEASLRERYESVKSKYGAVEQRVASHILVQVAEKASPAQVAAALAKAQDLAAKARQPGADFAALATANSDDVGSKDSGGDLGPVEKGVFGDAFDKAFFALQPGQVSDPVRLPDGWHVLLFRELIPGTAKSFEEVRPELEAEYLESERERVFNDISGKLVDKVYADPSELAPAAAELKLPITRTTDFTRGAGEGIAALEQVRKAAFEDSQKIDRQVSDPVEIEPNHIVVLHVIDYKPAAPMPFASIRDRVLADLTADQQAKASKVRAESFLARAEKGETLDALAFEAGRPVSDVPGVTRQAPNPQLAPLIDEAFRLSRPVAGKSQVGLAKLASDRYVLVTVSKVTDGDLKGLDAKTREGLKGQLAKARGAVDARSFVQALRKQYTIKVAEDRL
jgi:peptidyl-prolyl cis-trans isomerase D